MWLSALVSLYQVQGQPTPCSYVYDSVKSRDYVTVLYPSTVSKFSALILCRCWSRRRLARSPKEVRHIDHDRHRGERGWIIARLPGTIVNDGARTIPIVAPRIVLRSRTRLAGKVWQWQCCRTQSLADAVFVPITRSSVNHLCSYYRF